MSLEPSSFTSLLLLLLLFLLPPHSLIHPVKQINKQTNTRTTKPMSPANLWASCNDHSARQSVCFFIPFHSYSLSACSFPSTLSLSSGSFSSTLAVCLAVHSLPLLQSACSFPSTLTVCLPVHSLPLLQSVCRFILLHPCSLFACSFPSLQFQCLHFHSF